MKGSNSGNLSCDVIEESHDLVFCLCVELKSGNLRKIVKICQNASVFPKNLGLVQESFLEGRDGINFSWTPVLRKNYVCQCYCSEFQNIPSLTQSLSLVHEFFFFHIFS